MDKLTLISDKETTRIYENPKGIEFEITIDEDEHEVFLKCNDTGNSIGYFSFTELGVDDGYKSSFDGYKLTHMYIEEEYQRLGLGTLAVKFFKEWNGEPIFVSPNDGFEREDGSHLTGDGLPFAMKLMEEGIIEDFYN